MTPAESPVQTERKRVLARGAKKAMAAPSPVESPARRVSVKAIRNGCMGTGWDEGKPKADDK